MGGQGRLSFRLTREASEALVPGIVWSEWPRGREVLWVRGLSQVPLPVSQSFLLFLQQTCFEGLFF